jgi:uncharacterized protein YdeI (YjbR/CyaY-like superfamily)
MPHKNNIEAPTDFKTALAKNKKAQEAFEKLPPSHKRAYVEAILEAKKPETREKCIKDAIKMLSKKKI